VLLKRRLMRFVNYLILFAEMTVVFSSKAWNIKSKNEKSEKSEGRKKNKDVADRFHAITILMSAVPFILSVYA